MVTKFRVAIVGAGKIGAIRAGTVIKSRNSHLETIVDVVEAKSRALARNVGCSYGSDWAGVAKSPDIDILIVSTTNDSLARVAKVALDSGKHVFVEKPGATSSRDLAEMASLAEKSRVVCKVGFNHRFHPGILKLHELVNDDLLGEIVSIRGRHGHGGRPRYEKEWRANPVLSGGGELMDQGVHTLDLIDWFFPDMKRVAAWTSTCFWNMKVEDNAMLLLKNSSGVNAFLSVSWTQWKPVFSFEVYGTNGFAEVNGLGGAYGPETLTYENRVEGTIHRTVFPQQDESWRLEWDHFLQSIENNEEPMSSAKESRLVMKIVEAAYLSARDSSRVVSLG